MAGKTRKPKGPPQWFKCEAYSAADTLDAGDWLLNLTLRCWLNGYPNSQTEEALRRAGPVLRRGDAKQLHAMHEADCHGWPCTVQLATRSGWAEWFASQRRPELPPDVWEALRHGRVTSGICPLSVAALYTFERMLPEDVRQAGATFKQGDAPGLYPPGFRGSLDDAFGSGLAHQMTGRFVRVDLSLPDDVLHADLQRYLQAERDRLSAMGGPQLYREAARLKNKPSLRTLGTLATIGLLRFLDLDRWQRAANLGLKFGGVREMAGIARDREKELRLWVTLATSQMHLHAWFARLDRSVSPERRPRKFSG